MQRKFKEGLNPVNSFLSMIVGAILSTLLANFNSNPVTNILSILLLVWLAYSLYYSWKQWIIRPLKEEIEKKEKQLIREKEVSESLRGEIKRNIGLIEGKYGEFSEYLKKERLNKVLKKATLNTQGIEGICVHDFIIRGFDDKVKVTLNEYDKYFLYDVDINSTTQINYEFNLSHFREFIDLINLYEEVNNCEKLTEDILEDKTNNLIKNIINNICDGDDIILLMIYLLQSQNFGCYSIKKDNKYLEILNNVKTSMIGAVLLNGEVSVNYTGNNIIKKNRAYSSFYHVIEGEQKIVTLVFNKELVDLDNIFNRAIKDYFDMFN